MAIGDCKTETKFGYDDRFLYVAIHAIHVAGKRVPKAESRERDADLSGHDRVEFAFDLDRGNGETAFRFAVDHRGCLNESCWGDRSWNPKWFVAFDSMDTGWTAEIAIPIGEITGSSVANSTWGLQLSRIVPGMGEGKFAPLDERAELHFEK